MGMIYAVLIILTGALRLFLPYWITLAYAAVILWVGALGYLIFDSHDPLERELQAMLRARPQGTNSHQHGDA